MKTIEDLFSNVEAVIVDAHLVAYDGCHKIYLAMDATEAEWFRANYEYSFVGTNEEMLNKVKEWYEDSCSLRFVSAVEYNEYDPNAGFTTLIAQFADQEDEDDEYEDEDDDEDDED